MRSIAVDSGPLYALFDNADQYHARATDFLRALDGRLVTNLPVITEVASVDKDFTIYRTRRGSSFNNLFFGD